MYIFMGLYLRAGNFWLIISDVITVWRYLLLKKKLNDFSERTLNLHALNEIVCFN